MHSCGSCCSDAEDRGPTALARKAKDKMKILALEKDIPGASAADNTALLQDEARAVWELMQSGIIREIHFRVDCSQAVILLEAESTGQAQEVLAQLPLVKAKRIEFEFIGLRPYPGFARLFQPNPS
jgi:muconolactone delta-isomerase